MDRGTLVDSQIEDGLRLAEELVRSDFRMTSIFWVKASEDGQWYLYVASPLVDAEKLTEAYRRVHEVLQQMPQPFWIGPFDIKLIGSKSPLAEAAQELQSRRYGSIPVHRIGSKLGGLSIDGAYLYPPIAELKKEKSQP